MAESAIATPPAAVPTPAPSAPPPAPASEPLNDAFSDLDTLLKEPEPTKPDRSKPSDKLPEKKDEPPKPEVKGEPDFDPKKSAPKQLREAYEKLKTEMAQIRSERDEARKQASQPREDPEKKEYFERAEKYSKRAQELENELKFAKYEKSTEYQEKYWEPYVDAMSRARTKAAGLSVKDEEGNIRQIKPEDFDRYMSISDPGDASDFAEQMFGKHKSMLEAHRLEIEKAQSAMGNAVSKYRKEGVEKEKLNAEHEKLINQKKSEAWVAMNSDALNKYPTLFKADETDAKGKTLLSKGYDFSARAFIGNGAPLKEGQTQLNPLELLRTQSAVYNKAAAFDYQVYLRRKAEAHNKELQAELEEYKKSEPGPGEGGGDRGERELTPEQQLEELAV